MIKAKLNPQAVLGWVLGAGYLLMLAASLPGHLSYDSVIELYEGRFHQRVTWAPAFYSWVLGFFDHIVPGTGLYVVASGLLFFGTLWSLASLRGRVSWFAPALAALIVLTPDVLIYQAIVWKDILFANVALAGMVSLAHAAKAWDAKGVRWAWLAAALLLLAAGTLARQNGLIVALLGALALGWTGARGSWKAGLGWAAGGFVAVVMAAQIIGMAATPAKTDTNADFDKGVRILRHYDLLGALAIDPKLSMPAVEKNAPKSMAAMRANARAAYSPQRIDYLDDVAPLQSALWSMDDATVKTAWKDLILQHPGIYLRERWGAFRWVFATPVIDRCLSVYVGVDAPVDKMDKVGLTRRYNPTDESLQNYNSWFLDTPVVSHLTYAAIALLVAGVLLLRRDPGDVPIAALMLSALAFTASFFVISLACDYRYLYFLDLTGMLGALYLAIDPTLKRAKS